MTVLFEEALFQSWPPDLWRDVTNVVAVSGGADSVALLRGLHAVRQPGAGRLMVAHFHHGLRGRDADEDADFVAQLCRDLDLECCQGHAGDGALRPALTSEKDARDARYGFFRTVCLRYGARYLVTAHTADDQAETILHRIVRGTGIAGLAGIRPVRQFLPGVSLVRPLLALRRRQVTEYLQNLGQPFRTDRTNLDLQFTRNRIRNELLPQLTAQYNRGAVSALTRLGQLAGEVQEVVDQLMDHLLDQCVISRLPARVEVDCVRLRASHPYLVRELLLRLWREQGWPLRAMSLERWSEMAEMVLRECQSPVEKVFPGNITARRDGSTLSLLAGQ